MEGERVSRMAELSPTAHGLFSTFNRCFNSDGDAITPAMERERVSRMAELSPTANDLVRDDLDRVVVRLACEMHNPCASFMHPLMHPLCILYAFPYTLILTIDVLMQCGGPVSGARWMDYAMTDGLCHGHPEQQGQREEEEQQCNLAT